MIACHTNKLDLKPKMGKEGERRGGVESTKGKVKEEGRVGETDRERERIRWTVGRQSKLGDKILGLAKGELESER